MVQWHPTVDAALLRSTACSWWFSPIYIYWSSLMFLFQGRPLPLHPSNFPSKIFFTDLVSFILTTCPSHSNLRNFITTNTHLAYVILNAFPLQQWLHELASLLRYNYIVCIVVNFFPLSQQVSSEWSNANCYRQPVEFRPLVSTN